MEGNPQNNTDEDLAKITLKVAAAANVTGVEDAIRISDAGKIHTEIASNFVVSTEVVVYNA